MDNKSEMVEVVAEISLKRVLYITKVDGESISDTKARAEREIVLPHNALYMAAEALRRAGMHIEKLDLKDWEVINYNVKVEQPKEENV